MIFSSCSIKPISLCTQQANYSHLFTIIHVLLILAYVKAFENETYEVNLDVQENRFFEFTVPEEGISIQVEVISGVVILYGSYSNPNPGPIWHDFIVRGIDHSRDVFIPHPTENKKKRQIVQAVPFFCNVVGAHDNSTASVHAANGNVCRCVRCMQ